MQHRKGPKKRRIERKVNAKLSNFREGVYDILTYQGEEGHAQENKRSAEDLSQGTLRAGVPSPKLCAALYHGRGPLAECLERLFLDMPLSLVCASIFL